MKLGIITGTTRPGNVGTTVGEWVNENLATRTDIEVKDLKVAEATVNIFLGEEFPDGRFTPAEGKADDLQKLVDEIVALNDRQ